MKVVLREDVESLGKKGDLLDVADGYARNYLVPRGLALQATKGVVAQSEAMRRNREAREVRDRAAAEELADRLRAAPVRVTARAGEGGKLFGSVTTDRHRVGRRRGHRRRGRPPQDRAGRARSASSATSRSRSRSTPTSTSSIAVSVVAE